MSIQHFVIMQDDFDFTDHDCRTKKEGIKRVLKNIKSKMDFRPTVIAKWYGHIVLDFKYIWVFGKKESKIILSECDSAVYYTDQNHKKIKL